MSDSYSAMKWKSVWQERHSKRCCIPRSKLAWDTQGANARVHGQREPTAEAA